jgi:hypothetical protein
MQNYQHMIADMQAVVIARATEDKAFKAELLANPRATVEKVFNVEIPSDVKVEVKQSAANTVTLVLPWEIEPSKGGELSDSDLEAVSGGSKAGATSFFNKVGSGIAFGGTAIVGGATGTASLLESSAISVAKTCGL